MAIKHSHEYVCFQRNPTRGPVLVMAGTRHKTGQQVPIKRHVQYYLFHYVISGHGVVELPDGTNQTVSGGDWFFMFPGQTVRYYQQPDSYWRYYWLGFQGEEVESLLARAGIGPATGTRHGDRDKTSEHLFQDMLDVLDTNSATNDLEASLALMQLLCHLIRHTPEGNRLASSRDRQPLDTLVEEACRFIAEHYMEGISVSDVSDFMGFERSYFSKVFASTTGGTIRDHLAKCRLVRAQNLLKNSHQSIAEIATDVGYPEARTFSHFFKRRTGKSPQQWRSNVEHS